MNSGEGRASCSSLLGGMLCVACRHRKGRGTDSGMLKMEPRFGQAPFTFVRTFPRMSMLWLFKTFLRSFPLPNFRS